MRDNLDHALELEAAPCGWLCDCLREERFTWHVVNCKLIFGLSRVIDDADSLCVASRRLAIDGQDDITCFEASVGSHCEE